MSMPVILSCVQEVAQRQSPVGISDTLAGVSGSTDHNSTGGLSYQGTVGLGQSAQTTSCSACSLFWTLLTFCCVELSRFLKINHRSSPNRRTSPATSLITLLCNTLWQGTSFLQLPSPNIINDTGS